jgi:hypothetical protein
MSTQNHALVWMVFLNRLVDSGHVKIDALNPKVYLMDSVVSHYFLCGRDVKGEPFLGVPSTMMPHFTEIDWIECSISRELGYFFLEAKDPKTQMLNFVLGIKIRRKRLDVFCVEGKEDVHSQRLNIKVFEQDKEDPTEIIFADQHELVNLSMKEISCTSELGTELDAEDSRTMLGNSGIKRSYTNAKLTR